MINHELSEIFSLLADASEFKEENQFKVIAYRKASGIIKDFPQNIGEYAKNNSLKEIPGIGVGIAKKITEYIETGRITKFDEITEEIPNGILEMFKIPYLGPKTLKLAYEELAVDSLTKLKRAISSGNLALLTGMGKKKVKRISEAIQLFLKSEIGKRRFIIGDIYPLIEEIVEELGKVASRITPCGSYRRMKETVGDIDLLAVSDKGADIIQLFTRLPFVRKLIVSGKTKATILVNKPPVKIDIRISEEDSFGACLQYFTGSKSHNVKLRSFAKSKKMKINEYGVFKGTKKVGGKTEEEVYRSIGLDFIPPEMREDKGEIELAIKHKLPQIVDYKDFRGDLHIHSRFSDGTNSIMDIAKAAKKMKHEYVAICDHSKSATYASGLSSDMLLKKNEKIDMVNNDINGITVLKGVEVDILSNGELDYNDNILKTVDIVIAAIHQGFKKNVTERMLSVMENPYVNIIAHPTGRLISKRKGYEVNLEKVFAKAKEKSVVMEINAYSDRMDLSDINVAKAKEYGLKFSIGTDAHNLGMMRYWHLGIGIARRAWLKKEDIINCYPLDDLQQFLRKGN